MPRKSSPAGSRFARLVLLLLVFLGSAAAFLSPPRAHGQRERAALALQAKVQPQLLDAVAAGGAGGYVVRLNQQADLTPASVLRTRVEKGWFVYRALTRTAALTQPALCAELRRMGQNYQPFWITNCVVVKPPAGRSVRTAELARLALRPDVAAIEEDTEFHVEGQIGAEAVLPAEPNVAQVKAPLAWERGFHGQGVVIGVVDTGELWDHPALKHRYRGWNGTTVNHNYNWWDATTERKPVPLDYNGHGTHVTGTAVGDGGADHRIGVAPHARWIGVRVFLGSTGTVATVISGMQWLAAPTDVAGNHPRPDLAPAVANFSLGGGASSAVQSVTESLAAAGIYLVAAAGNSGPTCGSASGQPQASPVVLSVGSVDGTATVAGSSSRGPGSVSGHLQKPQLVARGVSVSSAWNDGAYRTISGTSMASPSVAGAAALLYSARPDLKGNRAVTTHLLQISARGLFVGSAASCGSPYAVPNYVYGFGELDCERLINHAQQW